MTTTENDTRTTDVSDYLALVDKELPQPEQPRYEVTRDTIRQFAYAISDYNALYLDNEFARSTRFGGIIAPAGYLYSHGNATWIRTLGTIRDPDGRVLSNNDNAGEDWEFFLPVRPGDHVVLRAKATAAIPKLGRKTGSSAIVYSESNYYNQRNELVARVTGSSFRFNREVVDERGGMTQIRAREPDAPSAASPATGAEHDDVGTTEVPFRETPPRRRDRQLYFEDVTAGMEIPPWTVGPLNAGHTARFSSQLSLPLEPTPGEHGSANAALISDLVGGVFAPGIMRTPWFGSMLMSWGGPSTWISKLSYQNREWVTGGFKAISRGKVIRKYEADGRCLVECDIWCENDIGRVTNPGSAVIELPSRA